jgi:hypothetical protein
MGDFAYMGGDAPTHDHSNHIGGYFFHPNQLVFSDPFHLVKTLLCTS